MGDLKFWGALTHSESDDELKHSRESFCRLKSPINRVSAGWLLQ